MPSESTEETAIVFAPSETTKVRTQMSDSTLRA